MRRGRACQVSGRSSSTSGIENQADSAGESQVAAAEEDDPTADGEAVGHADGDLGQPVDQLAGPTAEVDPRHPVEVVDRWLGSSVTELGAGGERPTGAGEHDDPRLVVGLQRAEDGLELVVQRHAQGVQLLGSVQGDRDQPVQLGVALDDDMLVLGHRRRVNHGRAAPSPDRRSRAPSPGIRVERPVRSDAVATMATGSAAFVPCSGPTWRDPFGMYEALRDHDPVHHVVDGDYWVLSRHADVFDAARDPATFSSAQRPDVRRATRSNASASTDARPMVMLDPPEHTAFRRLVARGFTPRQVAEIEPAVRAFVVERIERLRAAGSGDIVAELFKPLPSMVVAHYLGVPDEDRARFDGWTEAIVAANALGDPLGAAERGRRPVRLLHRAHRAAPRASRATTRSSHLVSLRSRRRPGRPAAASSASPSRWSPAATTPPRGSSAGRPSCSPNVPTNGHCCSSGRT